MVNAKQKGANAEREVAALLQPTVDRAYMETLGITLGEVPKLQRNLLQTREGGYDLVGLDWLALEVKRQEAVGTGGIRKGHLRQWWAQTVASSMGSAPLDMQGISLGSEWVTRWGSAPRVMRQIREPVLIYRPNGWTWTIRMYGYVVVGTGERQKKVKTPVLIELEPFLLWLDLRIRLELRGMGLGVGLADL